MLGSSSQLKRSLGIAICLALGLGFALIAFVPRLAGYRLSLTMLLICGSAGLAALWLVGFGFRGWNWKRRLAVGSLLVLCAVVATVLIDPRMRVRAGLATHEFAGDGTPRYHWRLKFWEKKPEPPTILASKDALPAKNSSEYYWPGYLGPKRNGVVEDLPLETDWQAHPPELIWRRPIGPGWSSFAVADGLAVTQEHREEGESVLAWELATGGDAWLHTQAGPVFLDPLGGNGSRATPTIDGEHVYAMSASGVLECLALKDGALRWSTNILKDANAQQSGRGMSCSPLVTDELVIMNAGGKSNNSMTAYNKQTGEIVWQAGNGRQAFCSPVVIHIGGTEQVVILNGPGLEGYRVKDGLPLWSYPWIVDGDGMISAAQPIILTSADSGNGFKSATTFDLSGNSDSPALDEAKIFISGGYGKGCVMLSVTGSGEEFKVSEVWTPNRSMKAKFSTPAFVGGYLYGLDEGIMVCVDPADGKRLWKKGRYGHGQMIVVNGLLLIQAENGGVHLVQPDPQDLREITQFEPLSDKTWTHPTLVGQLLLLRNSEEAVCYKLPLKQAKE